jgi:hypothetical protein
MADRGGKSVIEKTMNESPNEVTARNAGRSSQFRFGGLRLWHSVREFYRWRRLCTTVLKHP